MMEILAIAHSKKKPEFGPGSIVVDESKLNNIDINYLVEKDSNAMIDGKNIVIKNKKVRNLLYGVKYGKSSG